MANIRQIKLSDGQIYTIFDPVALHLDSSGRILCGNTIVDQAILAGSLSILTIDDVPVEDQITNVLTQDTLTGEIQKRSTNYLLEDIGGYSCKMEANNTLSLQLGKQN